MIRKVNNKLKISTLLLATVVLAAAGASVTTPSARADSINDTDFVITVDTTQGDPTFNTYFSIPTAGGVGHVYNYTVDCDNDGVIDASAQTSNYTCTYPTPGTYTIRIGGDFPHIYFNHTFPDRVKLISIDQWGTGKWRSMEQAFAGAINMDVKATDTPNLENTVYMNDMFRNASSLVGAGANWNWDTSNVTNMAGMFMGASKFNQNIGSWDVSKVAGMGHMFSGATQFNNGGSDSIKNWKLDSLTTADYMFENATSFNQPVDSWGMDKAEKLRAMFVNASSFNQSLASWNLTSLLNTSSAFSGAANMLDNTALSMANYDATLISWNSQNLLSPVTLGSAGLRYCLADNARTNLITPVGSGGHGWTVVGDRKDCPQYTLTFDSQGGTDVPSQSVTQGDTVAQPADPTREGFVFGGWFIDAAGTTQWDFAADVVSTGGDFTLYAKWTPVSEPAVPQQDSSTGLADTGVNLLAIVGAGLVLTLGGAALAAIKR